MNEFFEPFRYAFMQDALLVGVLVGAMCAVLSCFLILKGWSLMGDAVSHAVLPGIVLAYIFALPLTLGAFLAGLLCATGSGFLKRNSRLKEDTAMGVVYTGLFAIGLVLFSKTPSHMHLDHILVGNILGISDAQVQQTLLLGGCVLVVSLLLRRDLLLICFDPIQARVTGSVFDLLVAGSAGASDRGRNAGGRYHPRRRNADHTGLRGVSVDGSV
jgi:ABC-type Mn2+/Zn2+ transport system permease subunit